MMIGSKRFRKILRYGTLSSALLAAGLMTPENRATEFNIGTGNEQTLSAAVTDGTMAINSGTLNVAISSLGAVSTVSVKDAASLVFQDQKGPRTTVDCTLTAEAGGLVNFISGTSYTTIGHDGNRCLMLAGSGKTLTLAGAGTFKFSGGGTTAILSGNNVNAAFALSEGGWLNVVSGSNLVLGGYSSHISWTSNKGSLNAAGRVSLWDGNEITIDALTGSGIVEAGAVKLGIANTANSAAFGVADHTANFSGVLRNQIVNSAEKTTSLTKVGTGTQILSGSNTYTGKTTISAGTLQIGAGGTTGTLGTGAVTVADGATLAFSRSNTYTVKNSIANSGTISLLGGNYEFTALTFAGAGKVNVLGTAGLALSSKSMLEKTTFAPTAAAYLYANDADPAAWTAAEIASYRTGTSALAIGTTNINVCVKEGTSFTGNAVMVGDSPLQKLGMGTMKITADTSAFTQDLTIRAGSVTLSQNGKIASAISTDADGSLVYDYGTGSDTVLTSRITGTGALVIASGTVQVTTASPTYGGTTYTSVANTNVKDGATLIFQNTTGPRPSGTSTLTAEAGGTIRFLSTNTAMGHDGNQSLAISGTAGNLGFAGAGTFEFGGGGVTAIHTGSGTPKTTVALSGDGWFDVLANSGVCFGGYSANINWTNNKGSLNVSAGARANLWDGNEITIDSLTGSGFVEAGAVRLGIAGTRNSAKYGVTNNTATFSGVIRDAVVNGNNHSGSVVKVGSGTQILSGDSTYSGKTTISAGTLQVGDGGATGQLGTGAISVAANSTLAWNKSTETTLTSAQLTSCQGTISVMKSTVNLGSAETPFTTPTASSSFNADAGATLNYFMGDGASKTLNGSFTGSGTLHFVGSNATLNAAQGIFAMAADGKVILDGGSIQAPVSSSFGTLSVTGDTTWNLQDLSGAWHQTVYVASNGNLTPTSAFTSATEKGTTLNMANVANNTSDPEIRAAGLGNNSSWSYLTSIFVPEAVTVDLTGSFDDFAGVFLRKVANADGTTVNPDGSPISMDWQTVLKYGTNCAKVSTDGYVLGAGYYQLDARVGDQGGLALANNSGIKDASGKTLGLAIRETGTSTFSAFTIDPEAGTVAISKILTQNLNPTIQNKFEMAANTRLTIRNANPLESLQLKTQATGEGTLVLENAAPKNLKVDLTGSQISNLEVGGNITLALSKDHTFDVTDAYSETGPVTFAVDLTGISEDTNWFGNVDSANLNSNSKFVFTTSDLEMPLVNLTFFNSEAVSEAEWAKMLDFSQVADVLNFVSFTDASGLHLMVGDHDALPEPATLGMLVIGLCLGFSRFAFRKQTRIL